METIQLDTDPSASNEEHPDPWKCMESIQLDDEQTRPSDHGDETAACTHWINWIARTKHLLRACTTQPWFLQLQAEWKQYYQQHAENGVYGQRALGEAANPPMHKLDAWNGWVAQQHALMHIYGAEEWFQHLLNSVEEENTEETGSQREQTLNANNIPTAQELATDAEAQKRAPANIPLTRVKDPEQQHHHHPHLLHTEHLTAHKLWMLILAAVIEECELEHSMQDRELYLDALLEQL
ncbi:hypothetical protein AK88_05688 [Plasmodium fragile]|uniref:Schizont-infected cell agglutination C-terminal domain-containing protein n=1 Tax=Plasmodium fragile TaxID=5857 RepID=A0A0D9QCB2_PLAFR|nr:uncharacterized protein AK88_05688 [Plasmodium fragile]KJP84680.1 hypothetical protein AK88_05688 [Plasmodium fragile]